MNKGLFVIGAALLAGMIAFCAMRWHTHEGHGQTGGPAVDSMPELAWLRNDLQLSEEQFATVSELHAAYRPKCEEMCRRIADAHGRIAEIAKTSNTITPEYRAALREHADIHVECQEEMLKHLYGTAATLRKDQAERYLRTMLPFALDFSHSETGDPHVR